LPVFKKGRLNYFDIARVREYLGASKRLNRYVDKLSLSPSAQAASLAVLAASEPDKYRQDVESAVERCRTKEAIAWAMLEDARKTTPEKVPLLMDLHRAETEQRRKWEKDFADIAFSIGNAIPFDTIQKALSEAIEAAKNEMLSLCNSLPPDIENKSAADIVPILKSALLASLRHLSVASQKIEKQKD
jgi:hypothetical protein